MEITHLVPSQFNFFTADLSVPKINSVLKVVNWRSYVILIVAIRVFFFLRHTAVYSVLVVVSLSIQT